MAWFIDIENSVGFTNVDIKCTFRKRFFYSLSRFVCHMEYNKWRNFFVINLQPTAVTSIDFRIGCFRNDSLIVINGVSVYIICHHCVDCYFATIVTLDCGFSNLAWECKFGGFERRGKQSPNLLNQHLCIEQIIVVKTISTNQIDGCLSVGCFTEIH